MVRLSFDLFGGHRRNDKKIINMKTVYASKLNCFNPITIYQYSEHFEIFVLEEFKSGKRFYYDLSKLLEIHDFQRKTNLVVERIAFNDGSRKFFFYNQGRIVAHAKTRSILPKCRISSDRQRLEVDIREIDLFN